MALQIIYGRVGSGKHEQILDEIKEEVKKNPLGDSIFIVVPDQMVFQMEYEFVNDPEQNGLMRVQVVSFKRLAWWLMQEIGGTTKTYIDRSGIWMLIRRIIEEEKSDLGIYQRTMKHFGFVEQVERIFAEFKRFSITSERLLELIQIAEELKDTTLIRKLQDMHRLYVPFEQSMEKNYIDGTDRLKILELQLHQSEKMKRANIYVAGFYDFTPQELEVLGTMMEVCGKVTVVLTMEKNNPYAVQENSLFYMMMETYQQLMQVALDRKIQVLSDIELHAENRKMTKHASLIHLEQNYDMYPAKPYQGESAVHLFTAANRQGEIEAIAREIVELTRTGAYRYDDFVIIARNQAVYGDLIRYIFRQYQLPVYMDGKGKMLNHPLIELLRAVLAIYQSNFRYEAVFRALKTELLWQSGFSAKKERAEIDFLENFCLANGIHGAKKWQDDQAFRYVKIYYGEASFRKQTDEERKIEEKLQGMRQAIYQPLDVLFQKLDASKNVREKVLALYQFLEELHVTKRLNDWRKAAEEEGRPEEAKQHEQVWQAVMQLFDQLVEMMAEDEISNELWICLLESGFSSLQFSFVPVALDQIVIGDLEHSRYRHKKIAFVVGMVEGDFPKSVSEDSMLNTYERENLKENGVRLDYSARQRTFNDHTNIYMAFTLPTERLYLTVPFANEEGKALVASMLIRRIREILPTLKEQFFPANPLDAKWQTELHFIQKKNPTFLQMVRILQEYQRTGQIHPVWFEVYEAFYSQRYFQLEPVRTRTLDSLFYLNQAEQLSKETTEQLFGSEIEASISRIETFNRCPYQHFLRYGLQLKDRDAYEIESSHIGEFYHQCIEKMFDDLHVKNLLWQSLSKEQVDQLVEQTVAFVAPQIQKNIFMTTERYGYMLVKLKKVLKQVAWILKLQANKSDFQPYAMEIAFGKKGKLHPFTIDLENGKKLFLKGRIDQVDVGLIDNEQYVRVIDYKSGEKKLRWNDVYYGLALQLLTYLDVVAETVGREGEESLPAGALYFHVHRPFLKREGGLLNLADLEEDRLKEYKMNGLLIGDEDLVAHMDSDLSENGKCSKIVPAELKKDGTFSTRSSVIPKEQFSMVGKYVRHVFKQSGKKILDGHVELSPIRLNGKSPCAYCDYHAVCQFDRNLKENQYHYLQKLNEKEALEKILQKGGAQL